MDWFNLLILAHAEISDSHYETETSLKLAQLFVNAVNNSEE